VDVARGDKDPALHGVVRRFGRVYLVGDPVRDTIRAFHKNEELWSWFFINRGSV
jgi:hypothetical protein